MNARAFPLHKKYIKRTRKADHAGIEASAENSGGFGLPGVLVNAYFVVRGNGLHHDSLTCPRVRSLPALHYLPVLTGLANIYQDNIWPNSDDIFVGDDDVGLVAEEGVEFVAAANNQGVDMAAAFVEL